MIDDFLTRMAAVTRDEANALRDAPDQEAAGQSEYSAPIGGLSRARLLFKSGANELLDPGLDRHSTTSIAPRSRGRSPRSACGTGS